jgi:hypothetical protein
LPAICYLCIMEELTLITNPEFIRCDFPYWELETGILMTDAEVEEFLSSLYFIN